MINKLTVSVPSNFLDKSYQWLTAHMTWLLVIGLSGISIACFFYYSNNQLGLAYNDARSHLNIGRRVVEGLKPGLAQLGSVWLPLPHILMIPTIWIDSFWHSGFSGAIQSMVSFVATSMTIYFLLRRLGVTMGGRLFGVAVFVANLNILYLQSTAMTELLLLATMTLGIYFLVKWHQDENILFLLWSAFWILLSTLVRYDGWFLLFYATVLIILSGIRQRNWKKLEGLFVIFCTLAGFGVFLWLLWNTVIFHDPLYFAFGPYSAHAQQTQLETAGVLATKNNLLFSLKIYTYALVYNSGLLPVGMAVLGMWFLFKEKTLTSNVKIGMTALLASLFFNILALYLGHSVLFIQGLSGNTWFNVRYGIMLMPAIAFFSGYLFYKAKVFRPLLLGLFIFVTIFQFGNHDAVTIDDGRVGSSQKNVSEVSDWLQSHVPNEKGFVLISAASHDAIIFSSGLPMKRFIHEGTGAYWRSATSAPDRWARWIVMRTNDMNDQTFKLISQTNALDKYNLVHSFPFADIYQLKSEYVPLVQKEPVVPSQKIDLDQTNF